MKRGDKFVLTLTIFMFALSIFFIVYYFAGGKKDGSLKAEIYSDNELIKTIDLNSVASPYEFTVGDDDHYNVIRVENGRIRFESANCRDDVCVKTGWLDKKGEMAVCLPHKVYIKIQGSDEVDGTTY